MKEGHAMDLKIPGDSMQPNREKTLNKPQPDRLIRPLQQHRHGSHHGWAFV